MRKTRIAKERLEKYLKDDTARIYDMFHMLDTYGFRRLVQEAKERYLERFPDTELAQKFKQEDEDKRSAATKVKSSQYGVTSLLSGKASLGDQRKEVVKNEERIV
jgi:hypothetical protein